MQRNSQLRLVTDEPARASRIRSYGQQTAAVERVFAHWVRVMGKRPATTVLGPTRRLAIERALAWGYPEQVLLDACLGCSATPHNMGDNDRDTPYNDITLILRTEAHIERFAERAARVRALADASVPPAPDAMLTAEQATAAMARLREAAARLRAGARA